ncbi:MAG: Maf family nucleotide pyrophosphatase [Pseudomonadota bacterium]
MNENSNACALSYNAQPVVLASASQIRRRLLENAGIAVDVIKAKVDEAVIRETLLADGDMEPGDIAEILAQAKAENVSLHHGDRVVIAADQILSFDRRIYEKPQDYNQARAHLLAFSGHMHTLYSAVVLAAEGQVVWSHVDTACVWMRTVSPEFVGRYLARAGETALSSVGCYELEGVGLNLVEKVEGDYFTVLGLPMLPLLDELRRRDIIES